LPGLSCALFLTVAPEPFMPKTKEELKLLTESIGDDLDDLTFSPPEDGERGALVIWYWGQDSGDSDVHRRSWAFTKDQAKQIRDFIDRVILS
jgi:hypothetical protein